MIGAALISYLTFINVFVAVVDAALGQVAHSSAVLIHQLIELIRELLPVSLLILFGLALDDIILFVRHVVESNLIQKLIVLLVLRLRLRFVQTCWYGSSR